jgi:predicted nucleotidyltransferase
MAVSAKEELLAIIESHQKEIGNFGVRRYGLFGSFVREQHFDNFMNLAFFLEDLLGRKVDLVTAESLSPYIGPHILKEVEYAPISA